MNMAEMRNQVSYAYGGKYKKSPWYEKVKKMSDRQVQAIFFRLKQQGKL